MGRVNCTCVGRKEWVLEGFFRGQSLARVVDEQLLNEVKELLMLWVRC